MTEQLVSDADHLALTRLVVEIAWRIDHGRANTVWELFVPEGVLEHQRNAAGGARRNPRVG
jgi:hypothetical protein